MKTGERLNEYGTLVSVHTCNTCANEYTVCPAVDLPEQDNGGLYSNCMSEDCASYDPVHDLDSAFDTDEEIKQRDVVSINALRLRREQKES